MVNAVGTPAPPGSKIGLKDETQVSLRDIKYNIPMTPAIMIQDSECSVCAPEDMWTDKVSVPPTFPSNNTKIWETACFKKSPSQYYYFFYCNEGKAILYMCPWGQSGFRLWWNHAKHTCDRPQNVNGYDKDRAPWCSTSMYPNTGTAGKCSWDNVDSVKYGVKNTQIEAAKESKWKGRKRRSLRNYIKDNINGIEVKP